MKPLARGYIHQFAFFVAFGACGLLISQSHGVRALVSTTVYSLTLILLYGTSALYHRPNWSHRHYLIMRRFDHSAIFALIAGSATPICLLGLKGESGIELLITLWGVAIMGMLIAIHWVAAPKWARAFLYILIGWLALPYLPEIKFSVGAANFWFLFMGGVIYTVGAFIYAFKWPDPFPKIFGYHEIFHLFIVVASAFHFRVIYNLVENLPGLTTITT